MSRYVDSTEQLVVELFVRNLQQSLAFYRALGFDVLREEATFAVVAWEDHRLFLDQRDDLSEPPATPVMNVRVMVPDVDRVWQRLNEPGLRKELGLRMVAPMADRSYGLRDFTLADPDSFGVRFATRLRTSSTSLSLGVCVTARRLHESFAATTLHPELRWFCEPARWAVLPSKRRLRVETEGGTDFWQTTHYGFAADNGHFLFAEVAGDFVASTQVGFRGVHQYDQAGLMVRFSSSCWLKTSVEYEPDGPSRLGVVVTNAGYSDWSTQDFPAEESQLWLRIRREGSDYFVEGSRDGRGWSQLRLARLHEDQGGAAVACGLYACSPKAAGFVTEFGHLTIESGRLSPEHGDAK